jgi:glutathione S-transferase
MLEEAGARYSVRLVNIGSGDQHSPDFLVISPNNKIPALVDHDGSDGPRTVFESGATLMYLAEKTGCLLAASRPRCDQAMSWLFWSMSGIGPTFGQFLHFVSSYGPNVTDGEPLHYRGSSTGACAGEKVGGGPIPCRGLLNCGHWCLHMAQVRPPDHQEHRGRCVRSQPEC